MQKVIQKGVLEILTRLWQILLNASLLSLIIWNHIFILPFLQGSPILFLSAQQPSELGEGQVGESYTVKFMAE